MGRGQIRELGEVMFSTWLNAPGVSLAARAREHCQDEGWQRPTDDEIVAAYEMFEIIQRRERV